GLLFVVLVFFFFSSRRRHTRSYGDWSSDVCSSDLRSACRWYQPLGPPGSTHFSLDLVGPGLARWLAAWFPSSRFSSNMATRFISDSAPQPKASRGISS